MSRLPSLSLRLRLTLLWGAVCLLALLGLQALTLTILSAQLVNATDQGLALETLRYQQSVAGAASTTDLVARASEYLKGDSDAGNTYAAAYWIQFDNGVSLANTDDTSLFTTMASVRPGAGTPATVHDPRFGDMRVAAIAIDSGGRRVGVFHLALPLRSAQNLVSGLLVPIVIANVALVGLCGVLAYALTGRALAPVRTITATAAGISDGDLSRRIGYRGPRDEAGRLAETFDAMLERLQSGFEQRQAFYALASHELRTPLTIVRGHLDVLRRNRDPEVGEVRETLDIVLEELDHVTDQINDMLLLGRMLLGQRGPLAQVDAAGVVRDVYRKARGLALREWQLDAREPALVRADSEQLSRALLNLVTNAVRHTKEGGRVRLACGTSADEVFMAVADSGNGIRDTDMPKVFDPWYQAANRKAGVGGLGLTIVNEVAKAHNGRIEVESVEGRGTTFTMRLPLLLPKRDAGPRPQAALPAPLAPEKP
jgi:signal transduction histidine kinase